MNKHRQDNARKVKRIYPSSRPAMARIVKNNPEITIVVRLRFKTSFWDALKMRLVGTEFIRRYFEKNIRKK